MLLAFIFESVGSGEWLVLLAVILIVVGPKNLPAAARKVGSLISQLRRAADEFKRQIMTMDQEVRSSVEELKKEYVDVPEGSPTTDSSSNAEPIDGTADVADGITSTDTDSGEDPYASDYDYARAYGYDDAGPMMGEDASAASDVVAQAGDSLPSPDSASNVSEEKVVDENTAATC